MATRNQLLASLHCIKKERGWDDAEYRDILQARSGARSGADLDDAALARVVAALGAQQPKREAYISPWAWVKTAAKDKQDMLWKIRRICIEIGVAEKHQISYAEGAAARAFGCERHLKMMDGGELRVLIGALNNTLNHKRSVKP